MQKAPIEPWSPRWTTFCFVGFGTDRLRREEVMKTAGRETQTAGGPMALQPSTWRGVRGLQELAVQSRVLLCGCNNARSESGLTIARPAARAYASAATLC